jgi:hypothetical protein
MPLSLGVQVFALQAVGEGFVPGVGWVFAQRPDKPGGY